MQIVHKISGLIENDTLRIGSALPATRILAEKLGINRSTVYEAYQELYALGYVESRPGSYTRVRSRPKITARTKLPDQGLIDWGKITSSPSRRLYEIFERQRKDIMPPAPEGAIDLNRLEIDDRLFPVDEFRRCVNNVLSQKGGDLLRYGDYRGYGPLREYVARRSQAHGIAVNSEEILITNGAQQAIDLVFRLFTVPGQAVAFESPTYSLVLPLFESHGIRPLKIPMNENGLDLGHLEKTLKKDRPAFLYTIPNFHNPTGITTTQAHRETLLSICEEKKLPIIEDGFEEEMKYFGKVTLPIKSMDKNKIVVYLGTFSKVLFPGVRLGWIAAEKECVQRVTAIKRFSDLSTSNVIQAALYEFCRQGHYELHIRRMHRSFRKRMTAALESLEHNIPRELVSWTEPTGGYLIWLKLKKKHSDERVFQEICLRNGVKVSPGSHFFYDHTPDIHFRISISMLDEEEINAGIVALGRAIREFYS